MNSRITRIKKTTDSAVYEVVDSKGYRYIIKVFYRINRYRDELTYLEMMGDDINTPGGAAAPACSPLAPPLIISTFRRHHRGRVEFRL